MIPNSHLKLSLQCHHIARRIFIGANKLRLWLSWFCLQLQIWDADHWSANMEDASQTPPQLTTMPSIGDDIRISKKTLISLLLDLPIQELFVRSNMISDDDSDSATLNFIHELGRALSNARITSSTPKVSPKKRLYRINPHPTESSLQLEQPLTTRPRALTRLAAGVDDSLSSLEPQKPMQCPQKQEVYVDSRRQEMIKIANAMKSPAEGISTRMNRMLT